jgi:selenocysteine lyase/cysteine desulfurase
VADTSALAPDWDAARALYPGADETVYLDSAALGLISTRVHDAMTAVLDGHLMAGGAAVAGWREDAFEVRTAVAELVGGTDKGVAFTQNTSTGLAIVTNGLDWHAGGNVVVPAEEFPSNFYPWLQLRRHGVEVREVPCPGGHARLDDVRAAIDARTRVVSISAVQYSSGYRYDLGPLAEACRASNALFVVDATQAVGAVRVDVEADQVDVLAVSAHKWLLGPQGIGFLHLSPLAMERLHPSTVGWRSVGDPFAFDHEPVLADDARRFESGTENSAGIAGLGATVDLVLELGVEEVERRVLDRADRLAALLEAAGLTVRRPAERHRSGIVVAGTGAADPQALHAALLAEGVRCSQRAGGLRFAPHYFTDDADLERAAEVVRSRL